MPPRSSKKFSIIAAFRHSANCILSRSSSSRAFVLQGDTAKARHAYQDFFATWKDADPDIPVLLAAKSEYAKLQ